MGQVGDDDRGNLSMNEEKTQALDVGDEDSREEVENRRSTERRLKSKHVRGDSSVGRGPSFAWSVIWVIALCLCLKKKEK